MTIIYVDGFPSLGEDPNNPGYTKPDRNGRCYPIGIPEGLTKWHMAKEPDALVPGVERDMDGTPQVTSLYVEEGKIFGTVEIPEADRKRVEDGAPCLYSMGAKIPIRW
jgi:hypothetical protein